MPEQRKLALPIMEKSAIRRVREVKGQSISERRVARLSRRDPLPRHENGVNIFILISIALQRGLEILEIDITAAYLNTPMNDNVK